METKENIDSVGLIGGVPTVVNESVDSVSGKPVPNKSARGEPYISINGAVTAVTGVSQSLTMLPPVTSTGGTGSVENYSGSCKQFTIKKDIVIGAGVELIVAWSTVANNEAVTQNACTAKKASRLTPDGAPHTDVAVITDQDIEDFVKNWDGENPIKTISLLLTAASSVEPELELVV